MNAVLDSLVIYTLENGSLTSAATVASMICWVAMPQSLCICKYICDVLIAKLDKIFLAIHVAIAKRKSHMFTLREFCMTVHAVYATLCWRPFSPATSSERVENQIIQSCFPAIASVIALFLRRTRWRVCLLVWDLLTNEPILASPVTWSCRKTEHKEFYCCEFMIYIDVIR